MKRSTCSTPTRSATPAPAPARGRFARSAVAAAVAAGFSLGTTTTQAPALTIPPVLGGLTGGVIDLTCGLVGSLGLCVRIVTHAVVNGLTVEREANIIPIVAGVGVAQPLDVTGDGRSDITVAVAVPLKPGSLLTPDTSRPTLRVTRVAGAPANLPLKVEAVANDGSAPGRKVSFGFDSRESTAPSRFVAAIDQSNRDANPATNQARVALTIDSGSSNSVAFVQENFLGGSNLSEAQRTNRSITRFGYRAVAANGTVVPTGSTIDLTEQAGSQVVQIDSAGITTADVLLLSPGDDPRISATVGRLPTSVTLTLTDTDTDADGEADVTGVHIQGNADVPAAMLSFTHVSRDPDATDPILQAHRQTIGVDVVDLPRDASLTFEPGPGKIGYAASGRTGKVTITGDDEAPFFKRATHFQLALDDLPPQLDASYGDGTITADAHGDQVAKVVFSGRGAEQDLPTLCDPANPDSCDILGDTDAHGIKLDDLPSHYLLFARLFNLKLADVVTDPDTDATIDAAPDIVLGPPGSGCGEFPPPDCDAQSQSTIFHPFVAHVKKLRNADDASKGVATIDASLSALLRDTHFAMLTSGGQGGTIAYSYDNPNGSNLGPTIQVDAVNIDGLPTGRNGRQLDELHALMQATPDNFAFTYAADGFPLELSTAGAHKKSFAKAQVTLRSSGSTEALPLEEFRKYFRPDGFDEIERQIDGVLVRDFADRYVIDARIRKLSGFKVNKKQDGETGSGPCVSDDLCLTLGTIGNGTNQLQDPLLRFDSRTGIVTAPSNVPPISGSENVKATVDLVPGTLSVRQFTGAGGETRLVYGGDIEIPHGLELLQNTTHFPRSPQDDVFTLFDTFKELSVDPLPAGLTVCRSEDTSVCSNGAFGRDDADGGSLTLDATSKVRFRNSESANATPTQFKVFDVTMKHFELQNDATGSGYLGFDTGWSGQGTPSPDDVVTGSIRDVRGSGNRTELTFTNGFAAQHRMLFWPSETILFIAENTDIRDLTARSGNVLCNFPMSFALTRTKFAPGGIPIEIGLDLSDEFCQP